MNLHSLTTTEGSRKTRMRVGRGQGSGKGKTAGRGHKGQYARSGHKHKAGFEGGQMRLARRLPKRGFKSPTRVAFVPVNIEWLARFDDGAEVTPESLRAVGLAKGSPTGIKILGEGDLKKKLRVKAHAFSASARAKIEAAGGACEIIGATTA